MILDIFINSQYNVFTLMRYIFKKNQNRLSVILSQSEIPFKITEKLNHLHQQILLL